MRAHQHLLEREIDEADRRAAAVVQAAAMRACRRGSRRVRWPGAHRRRPWRRGRAARRPACRARAARRGAAPQTSLAPMCAAHRHAGEAEREVRGEGRERRIGALAAGRGIGHDADLVAARGLAAREIDHVAEQPADRGAQDVQDLERAIRPAIVLRTSARRCGRCRRGGPDSSATPRARSVRPLTWRLISILCLKARGVKPPAIATAVSTVMFGT